MVATSRVVLLFPVWVAIVCGHVQADRHWFIAAPRSLRTDVPETILLTGSDIGAPSELQLSLFTHPGRRQLWSREVYLAQDQTLIEPLILPKEELPLAQDGGSSHYVVLSARAKDFYREALLLVNPVSGYVIIQTDKPIYTPQQKVHLQIIGLNEDLRTSHGKYKLQIKNPQGITVEEKQFEFKDEEYRFFNHSFSFPPYVLLGTWKAIVFHGPQFTLNSTVELELQKYVLPTFGLHLETPDIILSNAEMIEGNVLAEYVYGEKVSGMATFKFGVKNEVGHIVSVASITNKKLVNGTADFALSVDHIRNHRDIGWFPDIAGKTLVVEVLVTEESTGKRESLADSRGVFASHAYLISFKKSINDFKPGLPVFIKAEVTYMQGDKAPNVPVFVSVRDQLGRSVIVDLPELKSNQEGEVLFTVETSKDHTSLSIHMRTKDRKFRQDFQAVAEHTIVKFVSETNGYLALVPSVNHTLKVGDTYEAKVFSRLSDKSAKLKYLVVSRGKILSYGDVSADSRIHFTISQDMVPRSRLVVWTHHFRSLVADSLLLTFQPICSPYVKVTLDPHFEEQSPGMPGKVRIRGPPNTLVGLLAVDKAVYLLKRNSQITTQKIFSLIGSHDQGCGAGGGFNSELVLDNAGIVILTDLDTAFSPRTHAIGCEEKRRRRRSIVNNLARGLNTESSKCCILGTKFDRYQRSCQTRAAIIRNYYRTEPLSNCSNAFLDCCQRYEMLLLDLPGTEVLTRTNTLAVHDDLDEIEFEQSTLVRYDFRETWIFDQLVIGSDGVAEYNSTLPHSITEWVMQAISVSLHSPGVCVADPQSLISTKPLFIQLHLPYAVVVGEQIELRASVFNYHNVSLHVMVYMYGVEDLCTGVQAGEKSPRKRITIPPHSQDTVSFPAVPMREGFFPIRVVALSPQGSDVITQDLHVVAKGTPVEKDIVIHLDPSNQQRRKRRNIGNEVLVDSIDTLHHLQHTEVTLQPPQDFVPGTESCIIMAIGDQYGPTVQTAISGLEHLMSQPTGCGEQTMIRMAPTLYALHYLSVKKQLTPEVEERAYQYLKEGYSRALTYRKYNGAFSVWTTHPPSTWLTAFILKIFCQARQYIHIDDMVISLGLRYLANQQRDDGSFREVYTLHHPEMLGGVQGKVPSTAFILISLLECGLKDERAKEVRDKALDFLAENLNSVLEPYSFSIITYALALANHPLRNVTNQRLRTMAVFNEVTNERWWYNPALPVSVEATSYALLSQLIFGNLDYSQAIVNWLNGQRSSSGSFVSTQDTVMGLQALTEYSIKADRPAINLVCNISYSQDVGLARSLEFQPDNAFILQQFEVNKMGGVLYLNTTGKGVGQLYVKMKYNIPRQPEKVCKFHVDILHQINQPTEAPSVINQDIPMDFFDIPGDLMTALGVENGPPSRRKRRSDLSDYRDWNNPHSLSEDIVMSPPVNSVFSLQLTICTKYLSDRDAGMTIIDVGIFSGYKPLMDALEKLAANKSNLIGRFEPSTRGILFYMDKIPHREPICLSFPIERDFIVGNVQPAVVKVYDYYNPDEACTSFYSTDRHNPAVKTVCQESICHCAEGGCPPTEPLAFITDHLVNWARPTVPETRRMREKLLRKACRQNDYVWKGEMLSLERRNRFSFQTFRINKVLKEGLESGVEVEGQARVLMSDQNCESAELIEGETYILMGRDGPKVLDEEGQTRVRYFLDQSTTIYRWESGMASTHHLRQLQKSMRWLETFLGATSCA